MTPQDPSNEARPDANRAFEEGFLLGVLVGEGHFGGDGKQPQVTLRMHARHASLFEWIQRRFPGGKLFGPYHHSQRHYYQWMARGAYLRDELLPLLRRRLAPDLDRKSYDAVQTMLSRYHRLLAADEDPSAAQLPNPHDEGLLAPGDALHP